MGQMDALSHTSRWWAELLFPGGVLGGEPDRWNPVDGHPGYAKTMSWLEEQGVEPADRPLQAKQLLTQSLLPDLVHAASGVERAAVLVRQHTAETQAWVDEFLPRSEAALAGRQVHAMDVLSTSLAFSEVVLWVRMLLDRIDRIDPTDRKYRVGLLPALAPGQVRDRVSRAADILRAELSGVRALANYTAHHSALPFPGAAADVAGDGTVSLRVPKPPPPDVYPPELLTYDGRQTAIPYSDGLLSAVAGFIDETIAAFREAQSP